MRKATRAVSVALAGALATSGMIPPAKAMHGVPIIGGGTSSSPVGGGPNIGGALVAGVVLYIASRIAVVTIIGATEHRFARLCEGLGTPCPAWQRGERKLLEAQWAYSNLSWVKDGGTYAPRWPTSIAEIKSIVAQHKRDMAFDAEQRRLYGY